VADAGSQDQRQSLPPNTANCPAAQAGDPGSNVAGPSLREYQRVVIEHIGAEISAGRRRILLVAPTGSGKTVIAGAIVADAVRRQQRVLLLAHRQELIVQMSQKLHDARIDHGIIKAGFVPRVGEAVQVASVQTLHARAVRTAKIDLPPADLVVVDEAHHSPARTYKRLLEAYPAAVILGMTATPCRGDGRGLGNAFDKIVECPPVSELIAAGFLVPTLVYAPTRPDLTGVKIARGDYVEGQLAERMDDQKLVGDIVTHWLRLAERRRTAVFTTGVAHSVHIRDQFRAANVAAEHIDASTPVAERDQILADLRAGVVEVVCNCMVLTEGWDEPDVSCIVLARPTKHHGLFRQMVGRVLRPAPDKANAIVLDHAGAVFEHGFVEEPIIWTLRPDRRAESPLQAWRDQHRAPGLTTCPECSAVRVSGKACPMCGWRPVPKPEALRVADGDLGEVDRQRKARAQVRSPEQMEKFQRQLKWIADERGYKPGWVAHQFKTKFGQWPVARHVRPMPPDEQVRSWVRSRQIAFAKGRGGRA
jgi:DNA repair protein RadD